MAMSVSSHYGEPELMRFRNGKAGAFTMQFDDSMETQAEIAIPIMDERRLVGTFFINPGHRRYGPHRDTWEVVCPRFGHELANHTMSHAGAASYEEAEREIGECSRHIWRLYPDRSKLLPFARGGGTTWSISEEEMCELMRRYYLFKRPSKYGICDDPESEYYHPGDIIEHAQEAIEGESWVQVHFHGIGGEWISCTKEAFLGLCDFLVANQDKLWVATEGDAWKYEQEYQAVSSVSLADPTDDGFRLAIECDESKIQTFGLPLSELYDEPLTVRVPVPGSWTRFVVVQARGDRADVRTYETVTVGGRRVAQFGVRPGVVAAMVTTIGYRTVEDSRLSQPSVAFQGGRAQALTHGWLDVKPGHHYELTLPTSDATPVGTRWEGGKRVRDAFQPVAQPDCVDKDEAGPLEPMFRRRFIFKLDDLSLYHIQGFQRFIDTVDTHGGKADMGISPGTCDEEVFDWLRSLDLSRFQLWNHTWDHGQAGPKHMGIPYDVQYQNVDAVQEIVERELGFTMVAWGYPGIRAYPEAAGDQWLEDGDFVTYLVIRNHLDLTVPLNAPRELADRGYNMINSEGVLTLNDVNHFEGPPGLGIRGDPGKRHPVAWVEDLYPCEDPLRPPPLGNGDELIWRLHHPSLRPSEGDAYDVLYAQIHPWFWQEQDQDGIGALIDHINGGGEWRCATLAESYHWLRDRDLVVLEKVTPDSYRLDAHRLHFRHRMELKLPERTTVKCRAYHSHSFDV
jgi:hypothetical protein